MSKIGIHGGHAKNGNKYCGAVSILNESVEDRLIKDVVIKYLKAKKHTVIDCTVDYGTSQTNILKNICAKSNEQFLDVSGSIHFNSCVNDLNGDGKTTGCEVFYTSDGNGKKCAVEICNELSKLGFKNRGAKHTDGLYFLNKTKADAFLVEVCFVDDKDDADLYRKVGCDAIGKAIATGILKGLGQDTTFSATTTVSSQPTTEGVSVTGSFKVRTRDVMNIRRTPSAKDRTNIVGTAPIGTYTIVKTYGDWGYLKSGIGWININTKYATRL